MTTGRHLVHEAVYDDYVAALAEQGRATCRSATRPPSRSRSARSSTSGSATRSTGWSPRASTRAPGWPRAAPTRGCSTSRPCWPTSRPRCPPTPSEVFGPVAPVLRFSTADEAAKLAADTEYGLSLGILTRDVMRGLELAGQIPTGIVHINDQTVDDEPNTPFGGVARLGHRRPLRRHRPTWTRSPTPAGSRCAARSRPTRSSRCAARHPRSMTVSRPDPGRHRRGRPGRAAAVAPAGAARHRLGAGGGPQPGLLRGPAAGRACWRTAASGCCARRAWRRGWTARAWSTAASTCSSPASGGTSTSAT